MEKNLDPKTKKRRATLLRRAVIVAAILGASVLVTYALIPDPFAVDLATVVRGTVRVTVDGDGRTRVKDRFVMVAPITGSLARLELRAGDTPLFRGKMGQRNDNIAVQVEQSNIKHHKTEAPA